MHRVTHKDYESKEEDRLSSELLRLCPKYGILGHSEDSKIIHSSKKRHTTFLPGRNRSTSVSICRSTNVRRSCLVDSVRKKGRFLSCGAALFEHVHIIYIVPHGLITKKQIKAKIRSEPKPDFAFQHLRRSCLVASEIYDALALSLPRSTTILPGRFRDLRRFCLVASEIYDALALSLLALLTFYSAHLPSKIYNSQQTRQKADSRDLRPDQGLYTRQNFPRPREALSPYMRGHQIPDSWGSLDFDVFTSRHFCGRKNVQYPQKRAIRKYHFKNDLRSDIRIVTDLILTINHVDHPGASYQGVDEERGDPWTYLWGTIEGFFGHSLAAIT